jgi:hypothetical protein
MKFLSNLSCSGQIKDGVIIASTAHNKKSINSGFIFLTPHLLQLNRP